MKLHELKPRPGSRRPRKRVGRGIAAGQGKTAGRGTKGQGARAGEGGKLYRQGGNLPFYRRLPFKRGFTNLFRKEWNEVNLEQLEGLDPGAEVTPEVLAEAGLLDDSANPVVLLGRGEVSVPLKVRVHRISRGARARIEAAGGEVELLPLEVNETAGWNRLQIGALNRFEAGSEVTPEAMAEAGLLRDPEKPVMLLGRGRLNVPLTVRVHRVSHRALRRIRAAGGKVELIVD